MNKYVISIVIILLLITCYGLYTRGYVTHSQYQEAKNQDARFQEQKDAYHARLESLNEVCDGSVPLSDKAYAKQEALKGDPEAQYVYASYLSEKFGVSYNNQNISDEALKWLLVAAGNGHVKSQGLLCAFTYNASKYKIRRNDNYSIDWCIKAAENDHQGSQVILSKMYIEGNGLNRSVEEFYFWSGVAGRRPEMNADLSEALPDKTKFEIDQRIMEWEKTHPKAQKSYSTAFREFSQASLYNLTQESIYTPDKIMDVHSFICGGDLRFCKTPERCGEARDCKIVDRCGDLVGLTCQSRPEYMIYNLSTKKVISECPGGLEPCLNFIPKEWTCKYADNLPIKNQYYEKFKKFRGGTGCGDYVFLPYFRTYIEDGTYYHYYHRETGEYSGGAREGPYVRKWNFMGRSKEWSYIGKSKGWSYMGKPKGWYCD